VHEDMPRPDRRDFPLFRAVETRWADTDLYGHVNNVAYYAWFDTVVNAVLIDRGVLDLAGDGPIFLVAETRCRYFAPISFPEILDVGLGIERLGNRSVAYRLGVFGAGEPAARAVGRFVHVCVDRTARTPVPIPHAARARLAPAVLELREPGDGGDRSGSAT
jgi:acyl-CoA thioester hydrolase